MKKFVKRVSVLIVSAMIALSSSIVSFADEGYTYTYDYWGDVMYSPDAYTVTTVLTTAQMGLDIPLNAAETLYVHDNFLYVCDTGNNRIVELERVDVDRLVVRRIIDSIKGHPTENALKNPSDIAISEEGHMFICDRANERILKLDMDLNYISEFTKPTDNNFDQGISFQPDKLIIDTAERIYCIAVNVNKGLIKYEADGTFSGFVGSTPVTYDWIDYIIKKFATKAQREQMAQFVPTEYDNIYVDDGGFIYAVTSRISADDIETGEAVPVRRLNLTGSDILVQNGEWGVVGDIYWDAGGGMDGPSRIVDVTAFDNESYAIVDRIRGRVFTYDDQGNLLWAFGGAGNSDGYFKYPVSIEHMGYDIFVLDQMDSSITMLSLTEYGKAVYESMDKFQDGDYEGSGESWQKVIGMNGNYDLAYIGIGRSLLRQERYEEAMDYFESKYDADNYSKAFKQYRKIWIADNIVWLIIVFLLVLLIPLLIGRIKRIKFQIDIADIFRL